MWGSLVLISPCFLDGFHADLGSVGGQREDEEGQWGKRGSRQPRGPAVQKSCFAAQLPHSWTNSTPPLSAPPPFAERRTKLVRGLQTGLCVAGACLSALRVPSQANLTGGRGACVHTYRHLPLLPFGAYSTPLKASILGSQPTPTSYPLAHLQT